jgi:hypothetical protein
MPPAEYFGEISKRVTRAKKKQNIGRTPEKSVKRRPKRPSPESGIPFVSVFLLGGLVAAIISSIALGVSVVFASDQLGGPSPNSQGLPFGGGGPSPGMQTGEVVVIMAVALFVISWMTVIVAIVRDQLLRRTADQAETRELRELVAALRIEIRQYGDERETDGYLTAMRESGPSKHGTARQLRPLPPDKA